MTSLLNQKKIRCGLGGEMHKGSGQGGNVGGERERGGEFIVVLVMNNHLAQGSKLDKKWEKMN